MKATHIYTEKFDTNRKLANRALKAIADIQECEQGTIRNPCNLASVIMKDKRTLIQTIYEDGYVRYNDDYYVVEVDEYCMYVDVTGKYLNECVVEKYDYTCDEGLEPLQDEDEKVKTTEKCDKMKTKERWQILANADLGSDVQHLAIEFAEFFKRAETSDEVDTHDLRFIIPLLRGFAHNNEDLMIVTECCDLCHVNILNELHTIDLLEDYLMNKHGWLERYQYANNKKIACREDEPISRQTRKFKH